MKIGVVGCGNISGIYLENLHQRFDAVDVHAVADLDEKRAASRAAEYGIPNVLSVDQLLSDPDIEIVLVLTNPESHADLCRRALENGKHAYTEKPLAIDFEDGRALVGLAEEKGLRIGAAPDTFMGGGLQTVRKLLDDGEIGSPVGAVAFMLSHGPEDWHPNPYPFYQPGAGPLFDMGPYYLTALVSLLGPMERVSAATRITSQERIVTRDGASGEKIPVNTPTHVAATLEFTGGAVATLGISFDVWAHRQPHIDLYGSEGSVAVPDPNRFGGPVSVYRQANAGWRDEALHYGYTTNSRGIGLVDMARAVVSGRPHRASGQLGLHVLEAMHGLLESGESGEFYSMTTSCEQPAAMPAAPGDPDLE
jgi:predicted dehydrogenase